jgi:hypothetical protein
MRLVLWLLVLGCFLKAGAQTRYDHELQLTETRFALESQIHGLKWGFLHNMDTAALGINNQGFVNLYKVWKDRPDQSSFLLQWKPTALWWSEDGLFGLTTGPFFTQAAKDSADLATGYFFTIWKRPHTGAPFKFVVDAGVQMVPGVAPSTFVSTPVVKEAITKTKTGSKAPSAVQLVSTEQAGTFRNMAAKESLAAALKSHTQENSFLLVSDFGKLSRNDWGRVGALNRTISLTPTDRRDLSSNCYYEWGQFRSSGGATATPLSGYYVHVWQMRPQKPLLLAAVYKFDQSLKP